MSKLNAKGSTGDKNIMLNAELIKIILEALIRFVLASRAAFFDAKCRLGLIKLEKIRIPEMQEFTTAMVYKISQ